MTAERDSAAPKTAGDRRSARKLLLGSVAAVVVLEAAVLLFFFLGKQAGGDWSSELLADAFGKRGASELKIGEYQVRSHAFGDTPVVVELSVFAQIPADRKKAFSAELERRRQRVDEAVSTVVRHADFIELQEPTLHSLRRRVLFAIKGVMGDQMESVDELILPDFRTIAAG